MKFTSLKSAMITAICAASLLSNFAHAEELSCGRFLSNEKPGFLGTIFTGKTSANSIVARREVVFQTSVELIKVLDQIDEIKEAWTSRAPHPLQRQLRVLAEELHNQLIAAVEDKDADNLVEKTEIMNDMFFVLDHATRVEHVNQKFLSPLLNYLPDLFRFKFVRPKPSNWNALVKFTRQNSRVRDWIRDQKALYEAVSEHKLPNEAVTGEMSMIRMALMLFGYEYADSQELDEQISKIAHTYEARIFIKALSDVDFPKIAGVYFPSNLYGVTARAVYQAHRLLTEGSASTWNDEHPNCEILHFLKTAPDAVWSRFLKNYKILFNEEADFLETDERKYLPNFNPSCVSAD